MSGVKRSSSEDWDDVFLRELEVQSTDEYEGASSSSDLHVVTGTAKRLLLDDENDPAVENMLIKTELLKKARLTNRTSFIDVKSFVKKHAGRRFSLDVRPEVALIIGDENETKTKFDLGRLGGYPCALRSIKVAFIGKIVFGEGDHGMFTVMYTGGDRCYVHSETTDLLYIVSERGLTELLLNYGYRNIYEMFDGPVSGSEESGIPLGMIPLAMFDKAEDVKGFVRDRACLSTFRQTAQLRPTDQIYGYFIIGDENGLHLGQLFPDRVFTCLREAGYYVLGRGELELVLLYNERLEVFALLDRGRLLKVANTIAGFLRDRLRNNLQPYRRCFKFRDDDPRVCIGQMVKFHCDVEYVVQGGTDFMRWLTAEDYPMIVEHCIPTM